MDHYFGNYRNIRYLWRPVRVSVEAQSRAEGIREPHPGARGHSGPDRQHTDRNPVRIHLHLLPGVIFLLSMVDLILF